MTPTDRRIRLAADGVIASYIHEISPRTATRPARVRRLDRTRRALRRRENSAYATHLARASRL